MLIRNSMDQSDAVPRGASPPRAGWRLGSPSAWTLRRPWSAPRAGSCVPSVGARAPRPQSANAQNDRIGPGSREAWGERSLSTAQRSPRQATCAQRPRMVWLDFKTGQSLRSGGPMNPARPGGSALCSGRSTQSTPSHLRSATEHGTDAIGNRALYSSCSSRYWIRSVEVTMPTSFSPSTTGRAWNWFLAKISAASRMLPVALRVMGLFCIRPSMLKV